MLLLGGFKILVQHYEESKNMRNQFTTANLLNVILFTVDKAAVYLVCISSSR